MFGTYSTKSISFQWLRQRYFVYFVGKCSAASIAKAKDAQILER